MALEPDQVIGEAISLLFQFFWSFAWPIIDWVVFIELENPLGEVAIFVAVLSALFVVPRGLKRLLSRA
jgi:hypothetical protein